MAIAVRLLLDRHDRAQVRTRMEFGFSVILIALLGSETLAQSRARDKDFGKMDHSVMRDKSRRKGG